ncbi:Gfo/Idh/MocA family protein [Fictibacillus sp. BK138]|uniref:Gfo/Idh/MocA family protein n=1 Tax=Fictibacillus sp. BK138 TaxID=2512121 RepID=UPI00102973C6|nr:Gfo/Idh/MocA family oxidoreductase [Fictibacillus sp. BK138]RZT21501.1 putative dehydrogenase [Fictibacillus sp. BK138]
MLKVGVIGLGSISDLHIKPYVNNPEVKLVAFCDMNQKRLEAAGQLYDVPNLYTSYQELLANQNVDAVSICTWNATHAEIAIAALEAGKHVLVEKPLCTTVEEAIQVEEAVKKSGKVLQVGFVRRYAKNTKLIKSFLDNGDFGELYYAKASCIRRLGNPGGWFSDKERSGGGPLMDLGVHMIDICWYLMGKPKPVSVSGHTYSKLGDRSNVQNLSFYKASDYDASLNSVEDLATALIRFENGASLYVDVSFTIHGVQDEVAVKLYGDKGGFELEPKLAMTTEKHDTIIKITPQIDHLNFQFEEAFQSEIEHFVSSCLGKTTTLSPVEDGLEVMKMLCGAYESARLGKEVLL